MKTEINNFNWFGFDLVVVWFANCDDLSIKTTIVELRTKWTSNQSSFNKKLASGKDEMTIIKIYVSFE